MKLRRLAQLVIVVASLVVLGSASAQTSWKGTSSTAWSTAANWTAGVPTAGIDAIIGDVNFTGTNQPNISSTAVCRSLTLGAGTLASILTISTSFTVSGNITIGANGRISHTSTSSSRVISLSGNWTNSGVYAGSSSSSAVTLSGTTQIIGGSTATGFRRLNINAGSITTLGSNISVTNTLSVSGTLDPGAGAGLVVSGAGTLSVASGGKILVRATTFAGNYANSGTKTLSAGSTVDYAASGDQSVSSSLTYSTLRISGSGIKTLTGNLPSLASSTATAGMLDLVAGTLDLSTFTANRGTSVAGGTVNVAAGAKLKIGGAGTFPANYATHGLAATSTVEYGGNNQTVTAESYGNLILSGSSGVVTKTMPASALTLAGNLTSSQGTATSVAATVGGALTVNGSVSLGTATTLNGGSFSHSCGGNWTNNGTFTGSTSTLTLNGVNTIVAGTGVNNVNNLVIARSGITADSATSLNVAGDFSTSGAGTFTHLPGGAGTVTLSGTGKTISGAGISFSKLTISGSSTTAASFSVADDLIVNGSLIASSGTITLSGTGKKIAGTGSMSFSGLQIPGSLTTTNSFSVGGNLGVSGSFSATAGMFTFAGSTTFSGAASLFNVTLNGLLLRMSADSILRLAGTTTLSTGTFDVTNQRPNTIVYSSSSSQTVYPITYDNLEIAAGGTKSIVGNLNVRGNFTIDAGAVFSGAAGGYTNYVWHDWLNYGTFNAGNSTIEMVGPANATISGATTFNRLRVNKDDATLLINLGTNQTVATLDMAIGTMDTGTNILTLTTTRTGGGHVLGTITRQHAFSTGVAYAFEGPFTTVSFTALSSVSSVTMAMTDGSISDFPSGAAVNRQYNISLAATGAYNATLRTYYQETELNGNNEATLTLWRNGGSGWILSGETGRDATNNWVENGALTDITGRWTMTGDSGMVRWNGSTSTAWETAANWTIVSGSPSRPPSTNDIVELGTTNVTYQPTVTSAAAARTISFGSAQAMTLTLGSGALLDTIGVQTIGNLGGVWTNNISHLINVGGQTMTVGGDLSLSDGTIGHTINLNIGAGTVNVANNLVQAGGANIIFTGAGTLNIGSDFHYTSGTFTSGSGTVNYNGSGAQVVGGVTYNQLSFNKPTGTAALPDAATVTGNLTLTNASHFRLSAPLSVAGSVLIATNTSLDLGGSEILVGGDWVCAGTLNISSGGEVAFNGTGAQFIGGGNFHDFDIEKPSGTATLMGNITVVVDADVYSGTLDLANYTIDDTDSGAAFTVAAGAKLRTAGNFPTGFTTTTIDPAATVEYYGSGNQTIASETYGHLIVTNGTGNPKTLAGPITVAGNLLIHSNATLAASAYPLTLLGNWTNNGAFSGGTGTVILNGTNQSVAGATIFNNMTVSGSYTVANCDIAIHGNATILGSYAAGSGTHTIDGDLLNSGAMSSSGTTTFTGTRLQTIQLLTAIQSISSGVVNFNGTVSPVLNSVAAPLFANVNINNTGGVTASVGWTVFTGFTVGAGASFNGNGFTHTFYGVVTNNGTLTSSGTLNFSPAAATTLALGSNFVSTGIVAFSGTNQVIISSGALILDSLLIANTHANGITPASNWTLTGDLRVNNGATFHAGTGLTHTISGNVDNSGNIDGGTSLVSFDGTTEIGGTGSTVWNHLRINGSLTAVTDLTVTGNFTNNGVFDAAGQALSFTGGAAAFIAGSTTPTTIASLVVAKSSATVTLGLNVSGLTALTISSGTLDTKSFSLLEDAANGGVLTVNAGGTLKLGGGNAFPVFTGGVSLDPASTVEYSGASAQTIAAQDYGHLTSSATGARTLAASGTIRIAGTFTPGPNAYTTTGSSIEFNGAGPQTVPAFSYHHLASSSTGARTLESAGNINVAGTFTPGANSYTVTNSTVNFNGAAQTIPAFTFHHLTTSGSGTKTLGGHIAVAGTFSLTAGSFADGGFTATNHGNIANAVTHSGLGQILLTGGVAEHQLSGAGVYQNLTLDDSFGAALSATNLTVNGTLSLANGQITTTTNRVTIGSAGTVTRTGGQVTGFLQKTVPTGSPTLTFEVGGTNVYAPVLLVLTNVTTSGALLVKSFDGGHPSVATSGLITNRTLNRYWALTNSGVGFSSYQATFYYSTNDLDAAVTGTNLFGRRFSGGNWTNLALGTRTATSIQTVSNTNFSEVAFGEVVIASRLGFQTPPSAIVTAGAIFPTQPVLRLENDLGELVTTDSSTVVTVARGAGSGSLQGSLSATAVNGLVAFTNLSHLVAGNITLNFSAPGLSGTNSGSITVNPGALHHFAFAAIAAQTVGAAFNVSITAQDANDNTVTSFSGTVGLTTTAGTISPIVSSTFSGGVRTESVALSQAGNGKTITATKTGGLETGTSPSFTVTPAVSALTVSTSADPSPTGSNVTFTAVVSSSAGTPTGTVQFRADGTALGSPVTLVSGGASRVTASLTHGSHTIAAEYPGDGNFFGSTNHLSQVINSPPAAGNDTLLRFPTTGAKGRSATLLANDTDPDGDSLTLSSVSATSAQGGTVVVANSWVLYTRPTGFTNADSFSYVATDGGLQATGSVAITIVADTDPSQNVVATEFLGNGDVRPHFLGIPGRTYSIQYTTNLVTPNWHSLGTATTAATGTLEFTDSPPPAAPTRFYRTTYP